MTGVYRSFGTPPGVSPDAAEHARQSLGEAVRTADALPAAAGTGLLDAARDSFTEGLRYGAGAGAVVLLAAAFLAWRLLRGQRLEES